MRPLDALRRTKRFGWIAVLAMAALTLGPTVSRALAAQAKPAADHAHCEGMEIPATSTSAPAAPPDHEPSGHDALQSCDLCVVATLPALLSTPAVPVDGVVAVDCPAPPATRAAAALRPIRSPASPRGPPERT